MAIYALRDFKTEFDGDLSFENGDMVVAGCEQSQRQYLMTWSLTTRGTFSIDPEVGWGAEYFINRPNNPFTHQAMEKDLGYAYSQAKDLNLNDLIYVVSYINQDVAGVTVRFSGLIVEPDGTSPQQGMVLGFSFPFYSGQIQQEVQF